MKRLVSSLLAAILITTPNLFAGVPLAPSSGPQQNFQPTSLVPSNGPHSQAAFADRIRGVVLLKRSNESVFTRVTGRTQVASGDTIKTEAGSCELLMENKTAMTLNPKSMLTLTELSFDVQNKSRTSLFKMDQGRLKARIGKLSKGSRFEVVTPTAIAAVRGTLLYLSAGVGENNQQFTELFVDESDKGVQFIHAQTGNEFLVQENQSSSALEDGGLEAPKELTAQEQQEFVKSWEQQTTQDAAQQGDVEEEEVPAQQEAADESVSDGLAEDDEAVEDVVTLDPEKAIEAAARADSGPSAEEIAAQNEREIFLQGLRRELNLIQTDIDFDRSIAHFEKIIDAQTGKVFTDIHGNRVRTEQYIFKPTDRSVEFLSLTYRGAGELAGISSLAFQVDFNSAIDRDLKDLPWNDYMNVVTAEQLDELGSPEFLTDNEEVMTGDDCGEGADFNQFIVHQSPQETIGEHAEERLLFYPISFKATFRNPSLDSLVFSENFGEAVKVAFNSEDDDVTELWVQAKSSDSTLILPQDGDSIEMISRVGSANELKINGLPATGLIVTYNVDGAETEGFRDDVVQNGFDSHLLRYNKTLHPAYFENRFLVVSEEDIYSKGDPNLNNYDFRVLRGVFVPMDNSGAPVGQPGFTLRGVRDLLHPNTAVNGGRYNLEALFTYGSMNPGTGEYTETFRIDTIITPEILEPYGLAGETRDDGLFPSNLNGETDSAGEFNRYYGPLPE